MIQIFEFSLIILLSMIKLMTFKLLSEYEEDINIIYIILNIETY